jgi:dienelactone hydrolase
MSITLSTLLLLGGATLAFADPIARPAAAPGETGNGWDPSYFNYKKPTTLVVEETTPTRAQVDWQRQPPKLPADLKAPVASPTPAKPFTHENLNLVRLRFRDLDGADVPALLCTPRDRKGPFPVVIALHGLGSHKAQVIAQVAPSLVKQGFAVLAPDMPLHGERPGNPRAMFDKGDLPGLVARAKQGVLDARLCIDLAESRPELDTKNGVILVGYSMGAIFDAVVGPADPRVKAMCLMVGGTIDVAPVFGMVPQLAAISPQLAIPHFARPLLMINARQDHIIKPEMGQRLYDAAAEPKQQVWYDSGHLLPAKAYEEAARWVAQTWQTLGAAR